MSESTALVAQTMDIAQLWSGMSNVEKAQALRSKFPKCTDKELEDMLLTMAALPLTPHPWRKEIHMLPFKNKKTGVTVYVPVVGIQAWWRNVLAHPDYQSNLSGVVCEGDEIEYQGSIPVIKKHGPGKKILYGWSVIYLKNGKSFFSIAHFDEYDKGNEMWEKFGKRMIIKCAETIGAKIAIAEFSHILTDVEEKAIQAVIDVQAEPVIEHRPEKIALYRSWQALQERGREAKELHAKFDELCESKVGLPLMQLNIEEVEKMQVVVDEIRQAKEAENAF